MTSLDLTSSAMLLISLASGIVAIIVSTVSGSLTGVLTTTAAVLVGFRLAGAGTIGVTGSVGAIT